MKKKHICLIFFLMLVSLSLLGGCGQKDVPMLSDGTYVMVMEDSEAIAPAINFNLEDKTFSFFYDPFSSYLNVGTVEISDGKAVCTTDDEQFTFVFQIIDNDTLEFLAEESSSVKTVDGYDAVLNHAEFRFVGQPVG